jgi:hypothetical protein
VYYQHLQLSLFEWCLNSYLLAQLRYVFTFWDRISCKEQESCRLNGIDNRYRLDEIAPLPFLSCYIQDYFYLG